MRMIRSFIDGSPVAIAGSPLGPVFAPTTGTVQGHVELGNADLLARAVAGAKAAQPAWAALNPQQRARVMFNFKALLEQYPNELA